MLKLAIQLPCGPSPPPCQLCSAFCVVGQNNDPVTSEIAQRNQQKVNQKSFKKRSDRTLKKRPRKNRGPERPRAPKVTKMAPKRAPRETNADLPKRFLFFFFRRWGLSSRKWSILEGFWFPNGAMWGHFGIDFWIILD